MPCNCLEHPINHLATMQTTLATAWQPSSIAMSMCFFYQAAYMRVIETQIKDPQMSLWQMEMWSLEVGVPWPKSEICHFLPLFLNLALFFFCNAGN